MEKNITYSPKRSRNSRYKQKIWEKPLKCRGFSFIILR